MLSVQSSTDGSFMSAPMIVRRPASRSFAMSAVRAAADAGRPDASFAARIWGTSVTGPLSLFHPRHSVGNPEPSTSPAYPRGR